MNWFKRLMEGRYGVDQLSYAMLILSLIFIILSSALKIPWLVIIGYIPLGIYIFRAMSRDIQKRGMENYRFSMLMSPVYSWFHKKKAHAKDKKTHKFVKCPNCSAKLRLPKGKGKIQVTCPKCGTQFIKKT